MKKSELRKIIREEIQFIREGGGESAGKLELVKIDIETAKDWIKRNGYTNTLNNWPSDFDKNFELAQKLAGLGKTKRKDMPVITDKDVKKFQAKLEQGEIDIYAPFSDDTPKDNPFPEGLRGTKAYTWLKAGLKDGEKRDDMIDINIKRKKVGNLKPIQKQIYFDKSMGATASSGVKKTTDFLSNKTFFITSSDNYIIDGHHRWLSGVLVDPNLTVNTLSINLSINKLLPMTAAYGDAIGNKRNS